MKTWLRQHRQAIATRARIERGAIGLRSKHLDADLDWQWGDGTSTFTLRTGPTTGSAVIGVAEMLAAPPSRMRLNARGRSEIAAGRRRVARPNARLSWTLM